MTTYLAHYTSPKAADVRGTGYFEFESDARIGSKGNVRDARMHMLREFGKDAVSWEIDKVEHPRPSAGIVDGQMELDFRPERKPRRKKRGRR